MIPVIKITALDTNNLFGLRNTYTHSVILHVFVQRTVIRGAKGDARVELRGTGAGKHLSGGPCRSAGSSSGPTRITKRETRRGMRVKVRRHFKLNGYLSLHLPEKTKGTRTRNEVIIYPPFYPSSSSRSSPSPCQTPSARPASNLAAAAAAAPRAPIHRPPTADSSHGAGVAQTTSSGLGLPPPGNCFSWRATATARGPAAPS